MWAKHTVIATPYGKAVELKDGKQTYAMPIIMNLGIVKIVSSRIISLSKGK